MERTKRRIDRIMEPGYIEGLAALATADVRARRLDAVEEEADLSFERRLLHGRIAIMQAELARRAGEGGETSLVDRLTAILTDDRTPTRGGFPGADPKFEYGAPKRKISKLLADDTLARLPDLSDDEIRARLSALEEVERETSGVRRAVQAVIDVLSEELAGRYRSGDADPGEALT